MSNIQDIYTSISNMEVGSVKSRNINKVNLLVRDSDLPCRLLLPSTSAQGDFIMIGNLQNVGWAVRDLCLWAPMSAGSGVEQFSESMLDYISLYLAEVKDNRNPATNANIVGMEVQMGPVPWGDKDYWAVDITLTIEEIL